MTFAFTITLLMALVPSPLQICLLLLSQVHQIHTSLEVDCNQYKYYIQHPNLEGYCIECRICPPSVSERLKNGACKAKIPNSIPGQGDAWCTGMNDRLPWCPPLSVRHGNLTCSGANSVYSKCSLQCDQGYGPESENLTRVECLESLLWNITDLHLLNCKRTAKPDKPRIVTVGQRAEVKSGSDKTLTCEAVPEAVGRLKTYWHFKDRQLPCDPDKSTYLISGASKENEGEYYCQVEDDLGKSELSAGYFLKVEESNTNVSDSEWKKVLVVAGTVVVVLLLILFIILIKGKKCYTLWCRIIKCICPKGEVHGTCLNSVETPISGSTETSCSSSKSDLGDSGQENTELIRQETNKKVLSLEPLLSHKEVYEGKKDKLIHQKHEVDFKLHKSTGAVYPDYYIYQDHVNIKSTGNADQNNLRSVFKNCQLMKKLRISLDQDADITSEKPTFHSLGRFLGNTQEEISHLEFKCRQTGNSPTDILIQKMIEHGQGASCLLSFLKQYSWTQQLAQDIESLMSQ